MHNGTSCIQPTIDLRTRVENLARMMRESCQMNTVLLARNGLGGLPLLDVKHLNCLILSSSNEEVTLVIEIQRRHMGVFLLRRSKCLK